MEQADLDIYDVAVEALVRFLSGDDSVTLEMFNTSLHILQAHYEI